MRVLSTALSIALFAQISFIPMSQAQTADMSSAPSANVAIDAAQHNGGTCGVVQHRRHRALRTYTRSRTITTTTTAPAQTQEVIQSAVTAPNCAPATIISQPAMVEGAPPVVFAQRTGPNLAALVAGGVLLATAIAVPIAVPLGIRHHHRAEARRRAALLQQQQLLLFAPPV